MAPKRILNTTSEAEPLARNPNLLKLNTWNLPDSTSNIAIGDVNYHLGSIKAPVIIHE